MKNMAKTRCKWDIRNEIAGLCRSGTIKTHIIFKAKLSTEQAETYLSEMTDADIIAADREETPSGMRNVYRTTVRGREFMSAYGGLLGMLDVKGGHSPRCGIDVCADILYVSLDGTRTGRLAQRAKITTNQTDTYTRALSDAGMLDTSDEPYGSVRRMKTYKTTEKGSSYIDSYMSMKEKFYGTPRHSELRLPSDFGNGRFTAGTGRSSA